MGEINRKWFDRLAGPIFALVAFVVYFLTLSDGAFPGESASLIAEHTGLTPSLSARMPIWRFCVWGVYSLFGDNFVFGLNLFSAICGSLSIYLLYGIMADLIMLAVDTSYVDERVAVRASRIAGIASVLMLSFCAPFWVVSTRLHMLSFDILILLGVVRILLDHASKGGVVRAWIFAFCYGVGIVEFQTLILFAPLCGGYLLFNMWREDQFSAKNITILTVSGLLGLTMYFVATVFFSKTLGYELFGYENYSHVLWTMWREQYGLMSRMLPKVGWAMVLVMAAGPWTTGMLVGKRALNEENEWSYYILHFLMTAVVVSVVVNVRFAPWPSLGFSRMMVTPYVLSAMAIGYLVAYWYILPSGWWHDAEEDDYAKLWVKKYLGSIVTVLLLVPLVVMPFVNISSTHGKHAHLTGEYVSEIVESVGDKNWLITDGRLDSEILISARSKGKTLRIINISWNNNPSYMRYVESILDDDMLKNCSRISMGFLLREWFKPSSDLISDVAVFTHTDLWAVEGLRLLPNKLVSFVETSDEKLDVEKIMFQHRAFWERVEPMVHRYSKSRSVATVTALSMSLYMAKQANNLGYVLGGAGFNDQAVECYNKARKIDDRNISSLLNLSMMIDSGADIENAEAIRKRMERLAQRPDRYKHLWRLTRDHGYVRNTSVLLRTGRTWALLGKPKMAINDIESAMNMMPLSDKHKFQEIVGIIALSADDHVQSEAVFLDILKSDAKNLRGLIGMARICRQKGAFAEAGEWIKKAEEAGALKTAIHIEKASLAISSGKLDDARLVLENLVELVPDMTLAWTLLAGTALAQNDDVGLNNALRKLSHLKGGVYSINVINAEKAMSSKDFLQAYDFYKQAFMIKKNELVLIDKLLRLATLLQKHDDAVNYAEKALEIDPDSAMGNLIIGNMMLLRGSYEFAEKYLRRGLRKERSPFLLNELAWALQKQNKLEESEKLVRESLSMNKNSYASWDTLGVVLIKLGKLDESRKALAQSVLLFKHNPQVYLHIFELELKSKNFEEARAIEKLLIDQTSFLSLESQNRFKELREMLEK